ncbi:MAG: biosynthetic peptidoglycan transglycosylase, partial [Deltaproteobacteria bacterium]
MSSSGSKGPPLRADKRYSATPKPKAKPAASTTTARKAAAPTKPRRTRNPTKAPLLLRPFIWAFRLLFSLMWKAGLACAVVLAGFVAYYASTLPPVEELLDARIKGSVTVMDREGKTFAWRGDQYGGVITTDTVSPYLTHAIVATEDKRFYRHFGISPRGVASAIRINMAEGRGPLEGNGGSTITQQVAKLLCLGVPFDPTMWKNQTEYEADCRRGSLVRKAKEAVYAMALEWKYSKDDILDIYMNRSFLGAGANGFEAASQRYFGKSSAKLKPAEAAMLAGLLKAPTRYAPTANLKRS